MRGVGDRNQKNDGIALKRNEKTEVINFLISCINHSRNKTTEMNRIVIARGEELKVQL